MRSFFLGCQFRNVSCQTFYSILIFFLRLLIFSGAYYLKEIRINLFKIYFLTYLLYLILLGIIRNYYNSNIRYIWGSISKIIHYLELIIKRQNISTIPLRWKYLQLMPLLLIYSIEIENYINVMPLLLVFSLHWKCLLGYISCQKANIVQDIVNNISPLLLY